MGLTAVSITRLYLDSNIFIYLFEGNDDRAKLLRDIVLKDSRAPKAFLATSELTLAETLIGAYAKRSDDLIGVYENWSLSNAYVEVGPVNRDILQMSAILRSAYRRIKLPDAIHLATAFAFGCSHFLSGDKDFGEEVIFADPQSRRFVPNNRLLVIRPDQAILNEIVGSVAE